MYLQHGIGVLGDTRYKYIFIDWALYLRHFADYATQKGRFYNDILKVCLVKSGDDSFVPPHLATIYE